MGLRPRRPPRGWPEPPEAVYLFAPDRRGERLAARLPSRNGVLEVDGYTGFERPTAAGDIRLASRSAHNRRNCYELRQAITSPIAAEALRRIAELHSVDALVRRQSAGPAQGHQAGGLAPACGRPQGLA
ncbi:IS66 family transposase [Caulobacter sp. KR2-114]|uniref:IS66 family transposase n=1 Tax=Caulobacter sp. KR2-114 TaxID=3400912 RepID=UPI003C0D1B26